MTTCPKNEEIILFLDGELSVNQCKELKEHFAQCSLCEKALGEFERILKRMAPSEEDKDPALVNGIMAAISHGLVKRPLKEQETSRPWYKWLWAPAVAIAAAASVAAICFNLGVFTAAPKSTRNTDPAFLARGGAETAEAENKRWFSFAVYARQTAGQSAYQEVRERISPDTRLVFSYTNLQKAPRQLMIFAVDNQGHIFWYYPAIDQRHPDPVGLDIQTGKFELSEEIKHELQPGPLKLMALFTKKPLSVSQVEHLLKSKLGAPINLAQLETIDWPEAFMLSRLLIVEKTTK